MMNQKAHISLFSLSALTLGLWLGQAGTALASPGSKAYKTECSACHVAYPTKGLSAKSWKGVMDNLADHFGDNAEMSPENTQLIRQYLLDNASSRRWFSSATSKSNRITDTRWFHRAHNEVSSRWVTGNPKVKTFARCDACHLQANRGNFSEDSVRIPGRGRRGDD